MYQTSGHTKQLTQQISSDLIENSRKIAFVATSIVMVAALICVIGWVFEIRDLKTLWLGKRMVLRSSTAIGFLLSAVSFLLIQFGKGGPTRKLDALAYTGLVLALIVCLGGAATFFEGILAVDWNLNWLIYAPSENAAGLTFPGPMPANVSLGLFFLSLGISLLPFRFGFMKWSWQVVCGISTLLSLFAFFGFLCGFDKLCTKFGCVEMPWTISVAFTILSLAPYCANPEGELTRVFVGNNISGRIARRLLTFVVAVPICLAIRNAVTSTGFFDLAFGWALFGVLVVASLIAVVVWSARTLETVDSARKEAEFKQEDTERKLTESFARQVVQLNMSHSEIRLKNVCLECTKEYPLDLEQCPDDQNRLVKLPDNSVIGTAFADKYYIIEELGKGGMATVYKARHLFLEHQVFAIKILAESQSNATTSIKRFQHEAKTASRLLHPNLIRIHDFGVSRKGQPYLLMDLIKGQSLKDLLDQVKRLDIQRFEQIFSQVFDGISYAHEQGVVHRDLKPANIMLVETEDGDERALIVDFGIAKGSEPTDVQLTKTGEVFGSPLYMSPEQWGGQRVDARSDIYALGCVMYEALVGNPPYKKETLFDILQSHLNEACPEFPKGLRIPENVQNAVKSCLAKEAAERPKSALAVKEMISSSKKTSHSV